MAKIPAWAYLIVGTIAVLYSTYVGKPELKMFIYTGYLFIAIGVFKTIVYFIFKGKDKEVIDKHKQFQQNNMQNSQTQQQIQPPQNNQYNEYVMACPRCQTPMKQVNMFCHRCGMKVQ